jgi:hypothetical protein
MKNFVYAFCATLMILATSCGSEKTAESTAVDSCATDSAACCKDTAAIVIPVDTNRESAEPKIDRPE